MNSSFAQRIKQNRFYALASEIKWQVEKSVARDQLQRFRVVSLVPRQPSKGNVLLSRINRAFLLRPGEPIPETHQNLWEAYQMALVFLDLGLAVDVIDYSNNIFLPSKDYSIFVDAKTNMERIGPLLNKECIKVFHAVTAHPLFQNAAELRRLLELQQRRGILLKPRRQDPLNWGIEHADCATILGNGFARNTYSYANKTLYRVPLAVPTTYPWPYDKDFAQARKRFLFLSGEGMVHKGLDRILEAFAAMPEYSLTVCGPIEKERDFVQAYRKELYETENIRAAGWVDVKSERFKEMANGCAGLIHASCSESGCASVITAMHAALIPIVSYESSVDIDPSYGIVLTSSSIEEIRQAVRSIAGSSAARLEHLARASWEYARENHSQEAFLSKYKQVISQILAGTGKGYAQAATKVCT